DLAAALEEIRGSGGDVDGVTGDVGNQQDVDRIVAAMLERYGSVDVLVNNASILGPRDTIANYPPAAWHEVLRINLTGVFLMTRAVLPTMLKQKAGSIINVTSGVARRGRARWGGYAVSKAGLEALTQVLADEVGEGGIRVNCVNPAATRTAMRAQAYPAEDPLTLPAPDEIMPVFVHLASDASASVNGQSLEARDWLNPK
ncbi:MAG TPA: SDR family NAD(P)-dependent oxidoreductase, partial [Candidatus Binatia bacterium]|nr:SDR family NAD(P)-dependent oxidoreductase [Candidatus Binatia bacterium]